MIARHFDRLAAAPDTGEKSVYTFVPGNLTELLLSFDLLPVLPEINSLQSAMRGKTAEYIALAEKLGPLRGRLHVRQERHRHDEVRQHRADRPAAAATRTSCCCPTPAVSRS